MSSPHSAVIICLYDRWPFNVGELFESAFAQLLPMIEAGTISRSMTLVLATPHGLQLPTFSRMLFQTLFDPAVTTLADFSTRTHLLMQDAAEHPLSRKFRRRSLSQHTTNTHSLPSSSALEEATFTNLSSLERTGVSSQQQGHARQGVEPSDARSRGIHSATLPGPAHKHRRLLLPTNPTVEASNIPAWMKSASTVEGLRLRCFESVALFKVTTRKDDQLCHCGQHVVSYYRERNQLPNTDPLFKQAGPETLRVVFASRPGANAHLLLNQDDLVAKCNSMLSQDTGRRQRARVQLSFDDQKPRDGGSGSRVKDPGRVENVTRHILGEGVQTGPGRWNSIQCITHVFGRDAMQDLQLASTSDVLVCVHGAVCYNAFFMKEGASMIEVRRG